MANIFVYVEKSSRKIYSVMSRAQSMGADYYEVIVSSPHDVQKNPHKWRGNLSEDGIELDPSPPETNRERRARLETAYATIIIAMGYEGNVSDIDEIVDFTDGIANKTIDDVYSLSKALCYYAVSVNTPDDDGIFDDS